jgi:hypothetical protein
VKIAVARDGPKSRLRDERLAAVGSGVVGVLVLFLHHANDQKRETVDRQAAAHRIDLAEQVLGQLETDKHHSTAKLLVDRVEEPAALRRDDIAHLGERGLHPSYVHREHVVPPLQLHVAAVLARNQPQRDAALPQQLHVPAGHRNPPALPQPLERHGRATGESDHDPATEPRRLAAKLVVEPFAECQEQAHGHRAPHDAQQGQERPELLASDIPEHLSQVQEHRGDGFPLPCRSISRERRVEAARRCCRPRPAPKSPRC